MGMMKWSAVFLLGSLVVSTSWAADLAGDPNFKAKCAVCHGTSAEGKPTIKIGPLKNAAAKSEGELVTRIENGGPGAAIKMPPFKDKLTSEEIKALVAEIKALK